MDIRNDLERRITKEQQKITDLRSQLDRAEAFVLGLQEALRMLPGSREKRSATGKLGFRSGNVKKTYDLLKQAGKPMQISEILIGIGKTDTKANRASLASSLYRSARKGGLIKKIGANLFSLQEIQAEVRETFNLPANFGKET